MKNLGKVGFVGAGGAYKGAISVGILKALCEAGIQPAYAFAVSVNVLNFAELFTSGIDSVIRTWKLLEKKGDGTLFSNRDIPFRFLKPSIYNNDGVKKLVANINMQTLISSPIRMEFPVINETAGFKTEIISNHDERFSENPELLSRYALAAVSVPGFLYPIKIGNDWYSDGQYISLESAIQAGCDTIFVILNDYIDEHKVVNPDLERWWIRFVNNYNITLSRDTEKHIDKILDEHKDYTILKTGSHVPFFGKFMSIIASVAHGDVDLIPHRIIPIAPKGPIGDLDSLSFSKNSVSLAIHHGYECGKEILDKLLE